MKNMVNIDVSAEAAAAGMAITGNNGLDAQSFIQQLEANSLRPFIPPEDHTAICVSFFTGNYDEHGEPIMRTEQIGRVTAANANSTLLLGDWEVIDKTIQQVAVGKSNLMNLFVDAGLTTPLDGMGITRYTWQRMSKMGKARMDMDMMSNTDKDRMEFDTQSLPIPIISSGWDVNMRYLAETRRWGHPIDTIQAYWAAYAVSQYGENLLVNGAGSFKADGGVIHGLRDTDTAITQTISKDWTDDSVTGKDIVDEIATWVSALKANHHYGPYTLILPDRYSHKLSLDYKDATNGSIYARILEKANNEQITLNISKIVYTEQINDDSSDSTKWANEAYLIEMDKSTLTIIDGMPMTDFQWAVKGPIVTEHKVAMIRVPLFRRDMDGQSGLLRAVGTSTAKA